MEVTQLENIHKMVKKIKPDILQINTGCMLLNESKGKENTVLGS